MYASETNPMCGWSAIIIIIIINITNIINMNITIYKKTINSFLKDFMHQTQAIQINRYRKVNNKTTTTTNKHLQSTH